MWLANDLETYFSSQFGFRNGKWNGADKPKRNGKRNGKDFR